MRFLQEYAELLARYEALSQEIGARGDYVQGGGGNTSVKLDDTLMAIKASGFCLSEVTREASYAVLDYAVLSHFYATHRPDEFEDVEAAGSSEAKRSIQTIDALPSLRPSVEAGFHSLLDGFVAHSHSVYANLAACALEAPSILERAFAGADYAYALVPYVDPGARLTFEIRDALDSTQKRTGKRPAILVMQNHGVIAHSDDEATCLALHADANERIARAFGLTGDACPVAKIKRNADGSFVSDTPYLAERLKQPRFDTKTLLESPLYPDQMVFFVGTLGEKALIDPETGLVAYHVPEKTALTLEQTLTAIVFITEQIENNGYTLSTLGEAARRFLANWESEKYRKALAEKG